jgi:monovalent cation/hydrogen antiporter
MPVFELVIALLLVGALLSGLARRAKVPYPALLALAGAALALLPNTPSVTLDPELALTLFVAPVLLDAAFDSSPRDLKHNWRPVAGLALIAVGLTVIAVAWVARFMEPALPWAAAIALGAIVAPPDAAAATAVLKQLRLPHRLLVILEGESLFNDASALLIYRMAVASAGAGALSGWDGVGMLLLSSLGSVALGVVLARLLSRVLEHLEDVATAVIVQFVSTFGIWLLAERLHLSGIISVVVFGITAARTAPDQTPARVRVPSYAVWEVAVFVLNVLAFMLVGLQLKPILQHLPGPELVRYVLTASAVCATVILVRIVWVSVSELIARWWRRRARLQPGQVAPTRSQPSTRAAVVVAWSGMRGIVTLAAALALPDGTHGRFAFPERDLILFTAFCVVLATLVLQGLTLNPLIQLLSLDADDSVEHEVKLARQETARAGLAALSEPHEDTALLRRKYEARLRRSEDGAESASDGATRFRDAAVRALEAERHTLSGMRNRGVIGDDAFHRIEEELDWAELNAATLRR